MTGSDFGFKKCKTREIKTGCRNQESWNWFQISHLRWSWNGPWMFWCHGLHSALLNLPSARVELGLWLPVGRGAAPWGHGMGSRWHCCLRGAAHIILMHTLLPGHPAHPEPVAQPSRVGWLFMLRGRKLRFFVSDVNSLAGFWFNGNFCSLKISVFTSVFQTHL